MRPTFRNHFSGLRVKRPIDASSIGRWRQHLRPDQSADSFLLFPERGLIVQAGILACNEVALLRLRQLLRLVFEPSNENASWLFNVPLLEIGLYDSMKHRSVNLLGHRSNQPVELVYFIDCLEKALGKTAMKNFLSLQPGDVPSTYADIDALAQDIGFRLTTHRGRHSALHRMVSFLLQLMGAAHTNSRYEIWPAATRVSYPLRWRTSS